MKNKTALKYLLVFLALCVMTVGLLLWHPWQRQPVTFYEPLILPIEAVDGDRIIMLDGSYVEINGNRTITSIKHDGNATIIKSSRRLTLWQSVTHDY